MLIEAIEHKFTSNKPPLDFAGNLPFTKRLDGTTFTGSPNGTTSANGNSLPIRCRPLFEHQRSVLRILPDPTAAYWALRWMRSFLPLRQSDGVEVFMFPAYVGYAGADEGWMSEMVANDAVIGVGGFGAQPWSNSAKSRLWNYGAWLAQHYAASSNIIWVLGGDFGTSASGSFSTAQANAVASLLAGMKSVATQASPLWAAHWGRPSLGSDLAQFAPFHRISNRSTRNTSWPHLEVRNVGTRPRPASPTFELEDYYEGDPSGGSGPDRQIPVVVVSRETAAGQSSSAM